MTRQKLHPESSYILLQPFSRMPAENFLILKDWHQEREEKPTSIFKNNYWWSFFVTEYFWIRTIFITSSTFWAVFAEASMKINPFSFANCSPSSVLTALLWARSHLLPMSIIDMFAFACCLASSSQLAKWLKVSLLKSKIIKNHCSWYITSLNGANMTLP